MVFNGSYLVYVDCVFDVWLEWVMGKDWVWMCG